MCVGTLSGVTSAGMVISSARGGTFIWKQIQKRKIFGYYQSNLLPDYVNLSIYKLLSSILITGMRCTFKCLYLLKNALFCALSRMQIYILMLYDKLLVKNTNFYLCRHSAYKDTSDLMQPETVSKFGISNISFLALAGVALWIEHRPANQRVSGQVPSRGRVRSNHTLMFPFFPPPFPSSL